MAPRILPGWQSLLGIYGQHLLDKPINSIRVEIALEVPLNISQLDGSRAGWGLDCVPAVSQRSRREAPFLQFQEKHLLKICRPCRALHQNPRQNNGYERLVHGPCPRATSRNCATPHASPKVAARKAQRTRCSTPRSANTRTARSSRCRARTRHRQTLRSGSMPCANRAPAV